MKSMFQIPKGAALEYIATDKMKAIVIKGIGYLIVGKKIEITPETFRNLAASMEEQNITKL